MTLDRADHDRLLSAASDALRKFCAMRFAALADKVTWQLRRLPASGLWGDGYAYRTVWDEFCHEMCDGPVDFSPLGFGPSVSDAFEMTIRPVIDALLERLPHEEAVLLTIHATNQLDDREQEDIAGSVDHDALAKTVYTQLCEKARRRDLSRFERR